MPTKKNKNTGEVAEPISRLDPRSGKMITYHPPEDLATPPDMSTVTRVATVAGKNPPVANLRDHPEWAGMDIVVKDVAFGEGEQDGRHSDYFLAQCFIFAPGQKPTKDNFVLLRTGAGNVYQRIASAFAANALPIQGTLRKGGRAWFLD